MKSSKNTVAQDEANFHKHEMRTTSTAAGSSKVQSNESITTSDIDSLLDELGPRFRDWAGRDPLPVDADLLPLVIPGYRPPFRFLPHRAKLALLNSEMTYLRRLARSMPPHFALGRNRENHGLAQAMVKLWEKSLIAKIAIKRGVPNTCNDRMAENIRALKHHISNLQEKMQAVKAELEQMRIKQISGVDEPTEIRSVISSNDVDLEEEGEEAYLETFEWDSDRPI